MQKIILHFAATIVCFISISSCNLRDSYEVYKEVHVLSGAQELLGQALIERNRLGGNPFNFTYFKILAFNGIKTDSTYAKRILTTKNFLSRMKLYFTKNFSDPNKIPVELHFQPTAIKLVSPFLKGHEYHVSGELYVISKGNIIAQGQGSYSGSSGLGMEGAFNHVHSYFLEVFSGALFILNANDIIVKKYSLTKEGCWNKKHKTWIKEAKRRNIIQACKVKTTQDIKTAIDKIDIKSELNTAKSNCTKLGFKEGSEKHGECVLKLFSK